MQIHYLWILIIWLIKSDNIGNPTLSPCKLQHFPLHLLIFHRVVMLKRSDIWKRRYYLVWIFCGSRKKPLFGSFQKVKKLDSGVFEINYSNFFSPFFTPTTRGYTRRWAQPVSVPPTTLFELVQCFLARIAVGGSFCSYSYTRSLIIISHLSAYNRHLLPFSVSKFNLFPWPPEHTAIYDDDDEDKTTTLTNLIINRQKTNTVSFPRILSTYDNATITRRDPRSKTAYLIPLFFRSRLFPLPRTPLTHVSSMISRKRIFIIYFDFSKDNYRIETRSHPLHSKQCKYVHAGTLEGTTERSLAKVQKNRVRMCNCHA